MLDNSGSGNTSTLEKLICTTLRRDIEPTIRHLVCSLYNFLRWGKNKATTCIRLCVARGKMHMRGKIPGLPRPKPVT